jgi:hypothetical protein
MLGIPVGCILFPSLLCRRPKGKSDEDECDIKATCEHSYAEVKNNFIFCLVSYGVKLAVILKKRYHEKRTHQ